MSHRQGGCWRLILSFEDVARHFEFAAADVEREDLGVCGDCDAAIGFVVNVELAKRRTGAVEI